MVTKSIFEELTTVDFKKMVLEFSSLMSEWPRDREVYFQITKQRVVFVNLLLKGP